MELEPGEDEKEVNECVVKTSSTALNRELTHQQKTTAESGDGEELWLNSFLNAKGIPKLYITDI